MADDVGQDLEVKGSTYRIPKMDDVADAVVAFTKYSESIPYSEYIQTEIISSDTRETLSVPVTDDYNGKMIVAQTDTNLEFGNLKNGFSVACVAENDSTITYFGVDKNGQKSTQYQVATVVTVNDLNILSLSSPYDGEIGGDGGSGGTDGLGTPPAPVITNPEGGSVIYFTPGTPDENQELALFHVAKIKKQSGAPLTTETVTVDQDSMEVVINGPQAFTNYIVDIYGVNDNGKGETASTNAFEIILQPTTQPNMNHTAYGQFTVTNHAQITRLFSEEQGRSLTVDYVGTNISGGGTFTHNGNGVITVSSVNSRWKIEPVFSGSSLTGPHTFFERKAITSTGQGCHGPDHEVTFCGQCSTCCGCYNEQGCWCAAGFNPPKEDPPPPGFVKKHGEWSKVNA